MNRISVGSGNALSPIRRQAITRTNAHLLSIGPYGRNLSDIPVKIQNFSFQKMHLKISSAKWRPFCPEEDGLMHVSKGGFPGLRCTVARENHSKIVYGFIIHANSFDQCCPHMKLRIGPGPIFADVTTAQLHICDLIESLNSWRNKGKFWKILIILEFDLWIVFNDMELTGVILACPIRSAPYSRTMDVYNLLCSSVWV